MSKAERILVIDDSEVILSKIRSVLLAAGFDVVTTAQTVGTARHLRGCDLVIVDYHMPGLNGGAVLESLRSAVADQSYTPLFYLYTTDPKVIESHHSLGFDGCFTRKGDVDALVPQIQAVFRMQRMVRATRSKAPPA
jgi:DNA-binding NarL/FixJ family response regulator